MISSTIKKASIGLAILAGTTSITPSYANEVAYKTLGVLTFAALTALYMRKPDPKFKSRVKLASNPIQKIGYFIADDIIGQAPASEKLKVDDEKNVVVPDGKAAAPAGLFGHISAYLKPISKAAKDLAFILIVYGILTKEDSTVFSSKSIAALAK